MKKLLGILLVGIFCLVSSGCGDDWKDDIYSIADMCVASEKHTVNISPYPEEHPVYISCYILKELNSNKQESWYYSYDEIIGFKYEEGYEYELRIAYMKTDLMDSSAPAKLLKVLSEKKKQSEGLPDPTTWTGFLH